MNYCIRLSWIAATFTVHLTAVPSLGVPDPLYYTSGAATPASGVFGGATINASIWQGVRFEVSEPIQITAVGGLISRNAVGNNSFFAALVRLTDINDFPDSHNLSSPDVLTVKTFVKPLDVAEDMMVPIEPLFVPAGTYCLVFGAGLLGTTGYGFMQQSSASIGSPSFIIRPGGTWQDSFVTHPMRFSVYAVPEPAVAWGIPALCAIGRRRHRSTI